MAFSIIQKKNHKMSEKRTWDESRSPQWRYLLSKDSKEKREAEKREERAEKAEGELKKGISKRKRKAAETQKEKNRRVYILYKGQGRGC